jgi:hypothetical protein
MGAVSLSIAGLAPVAFIVSTTKLLDHCWNSLAVMAMACGA